MGDQTPKLSFMGEVGGAEHFSKKSSRGKEKWKIAVCLENSKEPG